jgi:hypothetical protein
MLYRLCVAGAEVHPDFLRQKLNARQIAGWIAYYRLEPFGAMHNELLAGVIAAEIYNTSGNHPEGTQLIAPSDRMPSYESPEMTPEEIMRVVRGARRDD